MRFAELMEIAPGFSAFTDSIPGDLDGRFVIRTHPAHSVVRQKDSRLESVGILLSGTFRVINELENGNVFMIEMNDAVSFVGEVALMAGASHTSVTIEAVTDCLVAYLTAAEFDSWLSRDACFLKALSSHVARKLYFSSYHRGERQFYSSKYILLKYILGGISDSELEKNGTAVLRKTRQQISEEVGMTVKTINRTLLRFCENDWISICHGKVVLSAEQYSRAKKELKALVMQSRNGAPASGESIE
ncbi:MAG: Crp/Fnr family transcriptional regulator [Clostridia bacterium]|nr:Crp/Fnr family transcriptional regulator [Clostridia bacterium]